MNKTTKLLDETINKNLEMLDKLDPDSEKYGKIAKETRELIDRQTEKEKSKNKLGWVTGVGQLALSVVGLIAWIDIDKDGVIRSGIGKAFTNSIFKKK